MCRAIFYQTHLFFAQHLDFYDAVQGFDGIVISGEVQMAKPEPGIYTYLLTKYALRPEECFLLTIWRRILGPPGSAGWRATF